MSIHFAQVLTPQNIQEPKEKTKVLNSKIVLRKLVLSGTQRATLNGHDASSSTRIIDSRFDDSNQADAGSLLELHQLDSVSLGAPGTKWATRWSNSSGEKHKRVLLQCRCGYDHELRKTVKRRAPYAFTGCLAHVELVIERSTGKIRRVHGLLEHNLECQTAPLVCLPQRKAMPRPRTRHSPYARPLIHAQPSS